MFVAIVIRDHVLIDVIECWSIYHLLIRRYICYQTRKGWDQKQWRFSILLGWRNTQAAHVRICDFPMVLTRLDNWFPTSRANHRVTIQLLLILKRCGWQWIVFIVTLQRQLQMVMRLLFFRPWQAGNSLPFKSGRLKKVIFALKM